MPTSRASSYRAPGLPRKSQPRLRGSAFRARSGFATGSCSALPSLAPRFSSPPAVQVRGNGREKEERGGKTRGKRGEKERKKKEERRQEANQAAEKNANPFSRLTKKVWLNKKLTTHTKIQVYRACVLSTLLYCSESFVHGRRTPSICVASDGSLVPPGRTKFQIE